MVTVLYHNDADGFGAAFAVWRCFGRKEDINIIPVQYGQPVPEIPEGTTWLLIVDFSYDLETLRGLADRMQMLVIDHHASAEETLRKFRGYQGSDVAFDMDLSGAGLTWKIFADNGEVLPDLLAYVQDRDLWRFELPESEEVNLYIEQMPRTFDAWAEFDLDEARAAGAVLKAFRDNQIRRQVEQVRELDFLGHLVPVVNCVVNISEVGHALLQKFAFAPFAVMFFDRADGQRVFSMRSRGDFDVSALAVEQGGGGHKSAAGFSRVVAAEVLG